jgi:hypothetical protein
MSVPANVVEVPPMIYNESEVTKFYREVGNRDFHWHIIASDNPQPAGWNGPSRTIRFTDTLRNYEYDLNRCGLLMSYSLCTSGTQGAAPTNLNASSYVSPASDTFFDQVRFRIGATEISNMNGKEYMHKAAHIKKLLEYDPTHQSMIEGFEYFYPDTGTDGSATRVKFSATAEVATLNGVTPVGAGTIAAANTNNTFLLGVQGGAGTQLGPAVNPLAGVGGVAGTVNADGNPFFFITDNPVYNQGFDRRTNKTLGNAINTIWIPLRFYVNALEAVKDAESGLAIEMILRRPIDPETMFAANNAAAGAAITAPVPQNAAVNIVNLQFLIPAYTPSDYWKSNITAKLNHGAVSVRKYIDCDVLLATSQLVPAATSANITWTAVCNRRPVGCLIAYQFANDFQSQMGNTHRYFNPQFSSVQLQLGSGQFFPEQQITLTPNNLDNVALYREFLRFSDITNGQQANCVDFKSFINHKFFVPFDMRDIRSESLPNGQSLNINFQANHNAIRANPTGIDDAANGRYSGAVLAGTPVTPSVLVWLFLFVERAVQVKQTVTGVEILSDVDST